MMRRSKKWLFAVLSIGVLQLVACQEQEPDPRSAQQIDPMRAKMAEATGTALHRVRLTARRAVELGIKTAPLREEQIEGSLRKVVPIAAVVPDQNGEHWIFKSPDTLLFVRERVSIENIVGDLAVLRDGPETGTAVVTAGAANLLRNAFSETEQGSGEAATNEKGGGGKYTGTATMKEDGIIKVVYQAGGTGGLGASVVIEYKPQDEDYQKILDRVGGLKVGETKNLPPLSEK